MTGERYNENHIPGSVTQAMPNFGRWWIQPTEKSSTASLYNNKIDIHWHSHSVLTEQNYYAAQLLSPKLSVSTQAMQILIHLDLCTAAYTCCIHKFKFSWFAAAPHTILLRFTSRQWTFINYVFTLTSSALHTDTICRLQEMPVRFE